MTLMEAYTNFFAGPSKIETRAAATALATPIKLHPRIVSASKKWYGQNCTGRTACASFVLAVYVSSLYFIVHAAAKTVMNCTPYSLLHICMHDYTCACSLNPTYINIKEVFS